MRLNNPYFGSTLVLIAIIMSIMACTKNNEETLYGAVDCATENITFQERIQPIITNQCAFSGCHVQGGGSILLENYAQIKNSIDNGNFVQRVLVTRDMPPGTPLTDCQIASIQQWVDDGAPNN